MQTLAQLKSGQYSEITRLTLSENLTEFPKEIFSLANSLEVLDLANNQLTTLPNELSSLKKLKILFLTNNNLYLPSINSTYLWTSLVTQKKNIAFSLIQGQRNYFGGHKIKFYKN